jgi:hypothetical protein
LYAAEERAPGAKDRPASKESDAWGPEEDGLRTRLVPAQERYVLGQPAMLRLEMKNFGRQERTFDSQKVRVNNSLIVIGPDKKPARYVAGSFQTFGRGEPIAPNESVVLTEEIDVTEQYSVVKPGTYRIQFRGRDGIRGTSRIPPSNTVTVQMQPGQIPMSMQIPARLVEILPKNWDVSINGRISEVDDDGKVMPPGWESGPGTYLALVRDAQYKKDVLRVELWVADNKLARRATAQTGAAKLADAAVYLGKGTDGHVYWTLPEQAEKEWPEIRAKVRAALQIEEGNK